MSKSKSKVRWIEFVRTSHKDKELKKVLEAVNKELIDQGLSPEIVGIYEVVPTKKHPDKYGYSTRNILELSKLELVNRVVKKHLRKLRKD